MTLRISVFGPVLLLCLPACAQSSEQVAAQAAPQYGEAPHPLNRAIASCDSEFDRDLSRNDAHNRLGMMRKLEKAAVADDPERDRLEVRIAEHMVSSGKLDEACDLLADRRQRQADPYDPTEACLRAEFCGREND